MAWDTANGGNLVPRAEAEPKIKALALAQGIDGTFKVFYDGAMISTPSQLPEQVDMSKVRVSEVMNQAACAKPKGKGKGKKK
jgi:hypothetical protein